MKHPSNVICHQPAGHTLTDQETQYVWIHASQYAPIFGKKRKNGALRDYVSISYQGKKIYRKVETSGHLDVGKTSIALNYNSLAELGLLNSSSKGSQGNNLQTQVVDVQPASTHQFNWFHPDRGVRLDNRISLIAMLLSIIGIIFGIVI